MFMVLQYICLFSISTMHSSLTHFCTVKLIIIIIIIIIIKRVSHETKRAFDTRLKRDRNEVKTRQKRGVNEVRTRSPLVRTRRSRSKSARGIPCPWAVLYLHNNMFHCQSNQYYTHSHSHHLCPDTSGADLGGGLWGTVAQ